MAKEIPAGSSIGALLEELRASEDAMQSLDYHSLSKQHTAREQVGGAPRVGMGVGE